MKQQKKKNLETEQCSWESTKTANKENSVYTTRSKSNENTIGAATAHSQHKPALDHKSAITATSANKCWNYANKYGS